MPQVHTQSQNLYEQFMEVRKALSESTAGFWGDIEIFKQLNDAQKFIARKTKCLVRTVALTTVASTQEYDLRDTTFSDIMDIAEDGVYFKIAGTNYHPLKYRTKKQLNNESPGWQGVAAGTPTYYYYNKATKTIGLHPKPNSTNAGAYLYVTGYHFPKILIAGTASAGTTASITLPSGSSTVPCPSVTNDYYNGLYLQIYSGTGAGQQVEITDYVGSTRVCTATFTTAPSTDSIFGMVPQINEESHYLMPLYALWKLWPKGGSRRNLGLSYKQEFLEGLAAFVSEGIEEDDEELVKDTYR